MERVKTGINGFDELIEGGLPGGSKVLISGQAGAGKTIFSLEFLYKGALKGEKGVYFTFEEKKRSLIQQARQFGFDLEKLEEEGTIRIVSMGTENLERKTLFEIVEIIEKLDAKRVVVDSITTLAYLSAKSQGVQVISEEYFMKKFLYSFIAGFENLNDTVFFFISQADETLSNRVAEYLCDGIINITYESLSGDLSRTLSIKKMRKTKNSDEIHPFRITTDGVMVENL